MLLHSKHTKLKRFNNTKHKNINTRNRKPSRIIHQRQCYHTTKSFDNILSTETIPTQSIPISVQFFQDHASLFPYSDSPTTHSTNVTNLNSYLSSITLNIKRFDKVHPQISGNKFFKLKYHLLPHLSIPNDQKPVILTLGGAFSNHIAATAHATKEFQFPSIGLIRGEELSFKSLNPTLQLANQNGMNLLYIDRFMYKHRSHPQFNSCLTSQLQAKKHLYYYDEISAEQKEFFHHLALSSNPNQSDFFIPLYLRPDLSYEQLWSQLCHKPIEFIQEGGFSQQGLNGTSEMISDDELLSYSHILTAVGSGGTISGVVQHLINLQHSHQHYTYDNPQQSIQYAKLLGFPAVSTNEINFNLIHDYLMQHLKTLELSNEISIQSLFSFQTNYLGKGYGQTTPQLFDFIDAFETTYHIPIDQVYVGKMLYGIFDMLYKQQFPMNSKLLAFHTGGLQGKPQH